jgi:hypothetical protein
VNQTNITGTSLEMSLETETTYYWRVSVSDSTGTSGWSEEWSFTTASPHRVVLVAPGDGAVVTADSVELVWNESSPLIDRYWVERAGDSLFGSPLIDSLVTDTTYALTSLQHNERFWWKVRAHNSYGYGEFSEVRSFLVYMEIPAPPVLLSPPNGAMDVSTNLTLTWNASQGGEWYELELSDTADFSRLIVDEDSISSTSFDIVGLLNNETYYWRVSATNALGMSSWSEVWSFTTSLTAVGEEREEVPREFSLSQNYPNPFNPSTVIRYGLPVQSHVRLEVFNLLGERVQVLVDEEKEAGYHEAVFDATDLSSGMYIYRIRVDSFVATRRVLLIR